MANHYTNVVYLNGLEIREKDNYKSVIALNDISVGDLLLIEHAMVTDLAKLFAIVAYNEYLFDQYHPRISKWAETEDRSELAKTKVLHNSFNYNMQPLMTDFIAKCNHSCDPNCAISPNRTVFIFGECVAVFMEVYAVKNIPRGTEITISYGPDTGHHQSNDEYKRDFACNCDVQRNERLIKCNAALELANSFSKKNNSNIMAKINVYRDLQPARRIMMYQYLAQKGIIINDDKIVVADKTTGMKLINDVVRNNAKIDDDDLRPLDVFLKYMWRQFKSQDLIFF